MLLMHENMGLNYFASSPVLLPPESRAYGHAHSHHADPSPAATVTDPSSSTSMNPSPTTTSATTTSSANSKRFIPKYPPPPSLNYLAQSSNAVAGRKRSRTDIGEEEDDLAASDSIDGSSEPMFPDAAKPKPKPEPILGPGMTLIYPDEPSLNISPESQSGTWLEDMADADTVTTNSSNGGCGQHSPRSSPARPRPVARKSQRLLDENDAGVSMHQGANSNSNPSSSSGAEEIDPIVLHLGVGWKRLDGADRTGAIAGNETYIKKQFPLDDPRIMLSHEGWGIFVVRADARCGQWWLFKDDLRTCRFLTNDESDLFRRLSNKLFDPQRGIWHPDILAEGPELMAKDVAKGQGEVFLPATGVFVDRCQVGPAAQGERDVEMSMA